MASYTRDTDLGMKRILKELQDAIDTEIVIGVQEGSMNGKDDIAVYAMANEFGDDKIPERSFMRSAWDESLVAIRAKLDANIEMMKIGKYTLFQALSLVGLFVETKIKEKISSNIPPPNAEVTIKRKKSDRTLIDTGAMRQAIRYVVRRK